MRRRDWVDLAIVLGVWAAAIAIIHPRGEFPILDDWDFAIATWNFARTGHFHFTSFTAVSLRAMGLWGAAGARLFGGIFDVPRAPPPTLLLPTLLFVHRTAVFAGAGRGVRGPPLLRLAF